MLEARHDNERRLDQAALQPWRGSGAALLGGVGWAAGAAALEVLGKGGELALDVAASQRDAVTELEKRIRKSVEDNYRTWLSSSGSAARRPEDIEAALEQLGEALLLTRPTFLDMESVKRIGQDGKPIPDPLAKTLLAKLKERDSQSIFFASNTAAGIFTAMVEGVANLARTDKELQSQFAAVRFDLIMSKFDTAQKDSSAKHAELLAAIAARQGVPPKNLRPLFEAVAMEVPEADFERAIREAVTVLLARAVRRPEVLQDSIEIRNAIQAARERLAVLDTEGALSILREARATEALLRREKARGEARLAVEEAAILVDTYQWDDAILAYEEPTALEPDEAWYWVEIGDIRLSRGSLHAAAGAYHRGREVAERVGNDRDLLISHERIGSVLVAEGRLPEAREAFQAALGSAQLLTASDPGNTEWQRDLSVSQNKIGDLLLAEGKLSEARVAFEAGFTIRQRLAVSNPDNVECQRDLSVSHNKIGNILVAEGRLPQARAAFEQALGIAQQLVASDPGHAEWQRDLFVSHNKIGSVLMAEGKLLEARATYEAGLRIVQQLTTSDPGNANWQRDLSAGHEKIGDVLAAEGRRSEALAAYKESFGIRQKLAEDDSGNAEWQRNLSLCHSRIGDVLVAEGKLPEARAAFEAYLGIVERLAASDPSNARWQRDLSIGHNRIGDVLMAEGKLTEARTAFEADLAIANKLAAGDPGNAEWQRDMIVSHWKLAANGFSPRENYESALAISRRLTSEGKLAPVDDYFIPLLESRLAALTTP